MKLISKFISRNREISLNDFISEKLHLNKDIDVQHGDSLSNVKAPYIYPEPRDRQKMLEYKNKGSKPQTLVNTIKDTQKLKRRFAVAVDMKWGEAIEKFGDALVTRGVYKREEVDKFIEVHSK